MEKTVERLRGWAQASVVGNNPERFLNLCADRGIKLTNCRAISEVEIQCIIPRRYIAAAEKCAERAQCELKMLSYRGASYTVGKVKRRYILLSGLFIMLLLLGTSSLHVWDIDIVGNENISSSEILGVLNECGVHIGANWTEFNADMIRSEALSRIPELSFLTVNVHGSRATVIVRERIPVPDLAYNTEPCSIAAAKSGVVSSMNVFRGSPLVAVGNAVLAGDELISSNVPGVEIWGEVTKYNSVSAYGEVWANTFYEFTATESLEKQKKEPTGRRAQNYALVFGENRVNFYRNTGIYRDECDTIYDMWELKVDGLFTLPLSVVRETRAQYELQSIFLSPEMIESDLKTQLTQRLKREIGESGQLLSADFIIRQNDGELIVTLRASCLENIARIVHADDLIQPREEVVN